MVVAIGHMPGWIPVGLSTCEYVVDNSTGFWDRPTVMVYSHEKRRVLVWGPLPEDFPQIDETR